MMRQRFIEFTQRHGFVLLLLSAFSLTAYGGLVLQAGMFGDDAQLLYAFHRNGLAGYQRALGWSRPFGIWIYAVLYPLIGENITLWQISAIMLRTLSAWLLYRLLTQIKPEWRRPAIWTALACLLYPGFSQQAHALQFLLHWGALSASLASQVLMLRALEIKNKSKSFLTSLLAILLAIPGIISTEYFLGLELLRPVWLWLTIGKGKDREPISVVAKSWLPYLVILGAFSSWRIFTANIIYPRPLLLEQLRSDAQGALTGVLARIPSDIWKSGGLAWARVFDFKDLPAGILPYAITSIVLALFLCFLFWREAVESGKNRSHTAITFITLGLLLMLAGGLPLWISTTPLELSFPENRATLCMMIGACLLLAGTAHLLPTRVSLITISIILGFCAVFQFNISRQYRQTWQKMGDFLWQLTNCSPGLEPGTAILYEEPFIPSYPANSLAALLNWTYDPDNQSENWSYDMLRASERLGNIVPALEPSLPIHHGGFSGSTSQVLVVALDGQGCLHILGPQGEDKERNIPELLHQARSISNHAVMLNSVPAAHPPAFITHPVNTSSCECGQLIK